MRAIAAHGAGCEDPQVPFVLGARLVVLEALGKLVSVVEDLLHCARHGHQSSRGDWLDLPAGTTRNEQGCWMDGLLAPGLLRDAVVARSDAEQSIQAAVSDARGRGYSWAFIGSVLGTSGEAARQRYSSKQQA
jgi:hypothetical protein